MKRDLIKLLYFIIAWYLFALTGLWAIGVDLIVAKITLVWLPLAFTLTAMYAILQNKSWIK